MTFQKRMGQRCEAIGVELEAQSWDRIEILLKLWRSYGRSMNILGNSSASELDEHVLEAISVIALAQKIGITGAWLDVGSGGGFPALVIAACVENEMVLAEPRAKRAAFLEMALSQIKRSDCHVRRARVQIGEWEDLDNLQYDLPEFEIVDSRAVFSPEEWISVGKSWSSSWVFAHLRQQDASMIGEHGEAKFICEDSSWSIRAFPVK